MTETGCARCTCNTCVSPEIWADVNIWMQAGACQRRSGNLQIPRKVLPVYLCTKTLFPWRCIKTRKTNAKATISYAKNWIPCLYGILLCIKEANCSSDLYKHVSCKRSLKWARNHSISPDLCWKKTRHSAWADHSATSHSHPFPQHLSLPIRAQLLCIGGGQTTFSRNFFCVTNIKKCTGYKWGWETVFFHSI